MAQLLRCVPHDAVITGWDFSTGGVKHLAFDIHGKTLVTVLQTTDLFTTKEGASELNLAQLEGQAHVSVRQMGRWMAREKVLNRWLVGGISATHHTCGRIDADVVQVRRAICWDDQTLDRYHAQGLQRLGGDEAVRRLIAGPWAPRYSLSHLVKDEDPAYLDPKAWTRTWRILPHGPLAAGYLTGNFDVISWSSAASTGMMHLRDCRWEYGMLNALADQHHRDLIREELPKIVDQFQPVGPLGEHLAVEAGLNGSSGPIIFPTSDDQQAGLVGGGAVEDGQLAIVLGNSAVVNSSSNEMPGQGSQLDVMRLNWGPYLWMRCYSNGAQFLDAIVGKNPPWEELEKEGGLVSAGCDGAWVMPFARKELCLGVKAPAIRWSHPEPAARGVRYRAALEALAYLIARGVREHRDSGQAIKRITVSGGIARSHLMCEILASVIGQRLERLVSDEGPALGAAVTALAALETHLRRKQGDNTPYKVADAVAQMVKFRAPVEPNPAWRETYARGLEGFEERLKGLRSAGMS